MKHKTAHTGMFLALALILSYVETLIPFHFGIPGVKLGLANLITVVMLYCCGAKEAFVISVLRIVLAGFLFGSPFSNIWFKRGGCKLFGNVSALAYGQAACGFHQRSGRCVPQYWAAFYGGCRSREPKARLLYACTFGGRLSDRAFDWGTGAGDDCQGKTVDVIWI